jgi:hypothetical protein
MRTRAATTAVSLLAAACLLAACGGGGDDTASADEGDDIATLGTTAETETTSAGTTADGSTPGSTDAASEDPEEAMEEFAECMQEHGVDFPDPVAVGDEPQTVAITIAPGDEDNMAEAQEACGHLMENVRNDMELDPEQQAEMQADMLEFTECMRDQGIEMADPEFAEDGGVMINMSTGTAPEDAQGVAPRDDAEFQAAMEECGGPGEGGVLSVNDGNGEED